MKWPMLKFLLLFLAIYSGLNFYAWWMLSRPLAGNLPARVALAAFAVLMIFGPILVRYLERADLTRTAWVFGLVTYCWMAGLIWFVFLAALGDLWNLALRLLSHPWPAAGRLLIPPRLELSAIGVLVALAFVRSFFEARGMRLETLRLRSPRYHGAPLRILQISDVHLGLIERGRRLDQILALARQTQPDLILSTGDLVDGMGDRLNHLHERLAALQPRLGKFAVTGNHEYFVGIEKSLEFTRAAGFRLLRGEAVELDGGRLRLAGVDDPTRRQLEPGGAQDEAALLGAARDGVYTILLKHQPRLDERSFGRYDLMLSGHTHRGQIFPFSLVVRRFFPLLSGTHALPGGSILHISRGTGTWGPPLRLGSPPEVTLITVEGITA